MAPVVGAVLAIAGNLGISAAALTLAGKLLITVAISYAARALFAPDIPKSGKPVLQDRTFTVRDPTAVRTLVYGQTRTNGTIVFIDTTSNNKYLHLVIAFASHEIESFDTIYFDENALTLSGNDVSAPSRFAGKAWVYTHLGSDAQVADADLVAASTNWTSAHRLRGIAYAYVKLQYNATAYPNGIPNITALISGKKVWDPRTGTTAWSDNAALCATDYLLDSRYGLGVPQADIDSTVLTTAANTCEDSISLLGGGSEDRYTCNGVIDTDLTPKAIIEAMSTAKGAATVYNTGTWYVHAGSYKTPALTLAEDDLKEALQVTTRHPRAELFNQVKGTYPSPDNDWQPSDFPVVESSAYVAEDNGVVVFKELQLPLTSSAATAQRLGLLLLNAHRRQITVKAVCKLSAMDLIPSDVVQVTNTKLGWSSKTFEVVDWAFNIADDLSLGIGLTLRETDSAIYTWSTADESASHAAPTTNLPDFSVIAAPTGLSVSTYQVGTGAGDDETYKATLSWTAPTDEFVLSGGLIEVQYKLSADADWLPSWYVDGASTSAEIYQLELDTYDVRIRAYNHIAWSAWVTVTGFTVLGSGGVTTTQNWGDWLSTPGACGATPSCDWGEWVSSPSATDDWGSWT